MRDVVLGLGANLGSRIASLRAALDLIESRGDVEVAALSPFYETEPVGPPQPRFVNAAARLRTELSLEVLLDRALEVERALGRERRERWGPRVVDIDLLLSPGERVATDRLTVPHPRLAERPFALAPLLDVLPDPPAELADALSRLGGAPPVIAPAAREPAWRHTADPGATTVEAEGPDEPDALAAALTGVGREVGAACPGRGLSCRVVGTAGASPEGLLSATLDAIAGGLAVRAVVLGRDALVLRLVGRPGPAAPRAAPIAAEVRRSNGRAVARMVLRDGAK